MVGLCLRAAREIHPQIESCSPSVSAPDQEWSRYRTSKTRHRPFGEYTDGLRPSESEGERYLPKYLSKYLQEMERRSPTSADVPVRAGRESFRARTGETTVYEEDQQGRYLQFESWQVSSPRLEHKENENDVHLSVGPRDCRSHFSMCHGGRMSRSR